jgi:hypothetical protein
MPTDRNPLLKGAAPQPPNRLTFHQLAPQAHTSRATSIDLASFLVRNLLLQYTADPASGQ